MLSDGVVWWRAWVLSGRKRSVLLFAGILLLATFGEYLYLGFSSGRRANESRETDEFD